MIEKIILKLNQWKRRQFKAFKFKNSVAIEHIAKEVLGDELVKIKYVLFSDIDSGGAATGYIYIHLTESFLGVDDEAWLAKEENAKAALYGKAETGINLPRGFSIEFAYPGDSGLSEWEEEI